MYECGRMRSGRPEDAGKSFGMEDMNSIVHRIIFAQSEAFERNGNDIPFNFLIGGNGHIYEGRGWSIQTDESPIREHIVLTVAFLGTFVARRNDQAHR